MAPRIVPEESAARCLAVRPALKGISPGRGAGERHSEVEPKARGLASQDVPVRRFRSKRAARLLVVAAEAGNPLGAGRRRPRQLLPRLVEASERGLLKADLALELEASVAAAPPSEP